MKSNFIIFSCPTQQFSENAITHYEKDLSGMIEFFLRYDIFKDI